MASTNHDGPVAQLNLLHAVVLSGWSTSLDHKVAAVIISRYYPKYAGARASLRFLEDAIGATRPNIIASIRRLVSHGAFSVKVEGKGTRPTEYKLHFDFSSGTAHDTSASGTAHNTSCGIVGDTSGDDSGIAHDTKTYLHVPAYSAGIHEGRNFSAPPSAPLSDGLMATDADGAEGDGFDEFWKIWPRKHGLKKARAAWFKIVPKGDVITAARSWADHYAEHGTDKKWIAEPANWLAGERWMEDLPIIHGDAKGAAIAKAKANANAKKTTKASNDNFADEEPTGPSDYVCDVGVFSPFGTFDATIIGTEVKFVDPFTEQVEIHLAWDGYGTACATHTLFYQHKDQATQERGQAFIRSISDCLDIDELKDTDELHGRKIRCTINRRFAISYARAA